MKRYPSTTYVVVGLDILLLACCLLHLPGLIGRPAMPLSLLEGSNGPIVEKISHPELSGSLRSGDLLLTFHGNSVRDPRLVDFYIDQYSIAKPVGITFLRNGTTENTSITLIPFYSVSHLIVLVSVGLLTWVVGLFVLLTRPDELAARLFNIAMVSLATVIIISWEGVPEKGLLPDFASTFLFFASYSAVCTTMVHFTLLFPRKRIPLSFLRSSSVYAPAAILTIPVLLHYYRAVSWNSPAHYETYRTLFDAFHLMVLLYVGGGIASFIHSLVTARSSAERRQLQWILYGLVFGPTPFLFLTLLPDLLGQTWGIDEQYTLVFMALIPVAFAFSIIRYQAFYIDIVFKRTTAYAVVVSAMVGLYVLIVGTLARIASAFVLESYAIAAVVIGLLFEPVRRNVQKVVDRTFFKIDYNFREAERHFLERIKHTLNIQELADLIVRETNQVIPVDRIGFFILEQPGNRIRPLAQLNFDIVVGRSIHFQAEKLLTNLQLPVGRVDKMEPGITYEPANTEVFKRWGMALVFPMVSEAGTFMGFLVLGEKKAGTRFTVEDVDLLSNATTQAGLAIERIGLQRELVLKEAEAERLEEMNRLKSDFVSYVSHELRTPLTSIKLFSELLRDPNRQLDAKGKQFVRTIEGEADRLDRIVTTILDSTKIEHGVKQYDFRVTDLRSIATKALAIMDYQLKAHTFKVVRKIPRGRSPINADAESLLQVMINLLSNAIKYSAENKAVSIQVTNKGDVAICTIQDNGMGISPEALPHIFERFYRAPGHRQTIEGAGLGLPLVKNIMDAHGARVEIQSKVDQGTTVCLLLPLVKTNGQKTIRRVRTYGAVKKANTGR